MSNLYLALSSDGFLKLGLTTRDFRQRLQTIAYDHQVSMVLVGAKFGSSLEEEQALHNRLQQWRFIREGYGVSSSLEWYYDRTEVRNTIPRWVGELVLVKVRSVPFFQVQIKDDNSLTFIPNIPEE